MSETPVGTDTSTIDGLAASPYFDALRGRQRYPERLALRAICALEQWTDLGSWHVMAKRAGFNASVYRFDTAVKRLVELGLVNKIRTRKVYCSLAVRHQDVWNVLNRLDAEVLGWQPYEDE